MPKNPIDTTNGADLLPSPSIPLLTRLLVRLDVFAHHRAGLSLTVTFVIILGSVIPCAFVLLWLARIDHRIAVAAWAAASMGLPGLALWITYRLAHRTTVRPARPDEVTALRRYCPGKDWIYVQNVAASWRRVFPTPVTIAMILRWQDEAAARRRAAILPTMAELTTARDQARAFE